MNVKERILAINLMNKVKEHPKYAEEIGLVTKIQKKEIVNKNGGKQE